MEQPARDERAGHDPGARGSDGIRRVATYGFSDLERRLPVGLDQLFQIGSISSRSSQSPCSDSWIDASSISTNRSPSTCWFASSPILRPSPHHLLTHSSGLPANAPMFFPDPAQRHLPRRSGAYSKYFHYSNLGYTLLGYLLWSLDGRPMPTALGPGAGTAGHEPERAGDHARHTRESREELCGLPERSALSEAPAVCPKPRE